MRCYVCREPTDVNVMMTDESLDYIDNVTNHYGLVHIDGPDDCFLADDGSEYAGLVIVCRKCGDEAQEDVAYDQFVNLLETQP